MSNEDERRPERARSAEAGATRRDDGKRALFSSAVRKNGTLVVESDPVAGVTVRENEVVALFVC